METCYKVFRREVLQRHPAHENRFGFEPEITAKVGAGAARASTRCRSPTAAATYAEGKKISWRDGVAALWFIIKFNLWGWRSFAGTRSRARREGRWLASRESGARRDPRKPCRSMIAERHVSRGPVKATTAQATTVKATTVKATASRRSGRIDSRVRFHRPSWRVSALGTIERHPSRGSRRAPLPRDGTQPPSRRARLRDCRRVFPV